MTGIIIIPAIPAVTALIFRHKPGHPAYFLKPIYENLINRQKKGQKYDV